MSPTLLKSKAEKQQAEASQSEGVEKSVEGVMSIRFYKPTIVRVGDVVIKAYEPLGEREVLEKIEIKTKSDAVDAVYRKIQREKRKLIEGNESLMVEIEVKGKGFALYLGDISRKEPNGDTTILFPRPAKLNRIGVYRNNRVVWTTLRKEEYYVYEGYVELPEDVELVFLDTSYGIRVLRNHIGKSTK
uniref:Uncharacterized protein n=1 Tax=Fervidicoccus fontis TaxID=683846 RepID=A0A7J3ZLY9_9CREN